MKSKDVVMGTAERGQKTIRSTGMDNSSYGETGTKSIKNADFKGGVGDLSSSIKDGKVRSY